MYKIYFAVQPGPTVVIVSQYENGSATQVNFVPLSKDTGELEAELTALNMSRIEAALLQPEEKKTIFGSSKKAIDMFLGIEKPSNREIEEIILAGKSIFVPFSKMIFIKEEENIASKWEYKNA